MTTEADVLKMKMELTAKDEAMEALAGMTDELKTDPIVDGVEIKTKNQGDSSKSWIDTLDPGEAISVSYVDMNLLYGSSDTFRTSAGGFFYNVLEDGKYQVPPPFRTFDPNKPINPYMHSIISITRQTVNQAAAEFGSLGAADDDRDVKLRGFDEESPYFQDIILPYVQFVSQIEGNPEAEYLSDIMFGNKVWKTLFTGGKFLYDDIAPIF